ncbi:MAG: hypothetical protein CMN77_16925 [Spirochaetaceae bacterium]|nr:hypothetical protein [Spirochaetaceae bacterium]
MEIIWRATDPSKEGVEWLSFISLITLGVVPTYFSSTSEVSWYVKEKDGTEHELAKDEFHRFTLIGWIFLPAAVIVAPISDSIDANAAEKNDTYAAIRTLDHDRYIELSNSQRAQSIFDKIADRKQRNSKAFLRLTEKGGNWMEFRDQYYSLENPDQKKQALEILKDQYKAWVQSEVQRMTGLSPSTVVYWSNGSRWGPLWAMFRSTLPLVGPETNFAIKFVPASQCEGAGRVNANYCYLMVNKGEETFLFLKEKGNKLYIVGLGSGIEVNNYNWERTAAYLLSKISQWPELWSKLTNEGLLQHPIPPQQ